MVPAALNFKKYVGAVVADVFQITVDAFFCAFDGNALEALRALNVQADKFQ